MSLLMISQNSILKNKYFHFLSLSCLCLILFQPLAKANTQLLEQFALVDTSSGEKVLTLNDGGRLFLNDLPETFTIEVIPENVNEIPASVSLSIGNCGDLNLSNVDSDLPFILSTEINSLTASDFSEGLCTITAVPYSEPQGNGAIGEPLSVTFSVVAASFPTIEGFELIDGVSQQSLQPISSGSTVQLFGLPEQFNIEVLSSNSELTGSIGIEMSGCLSSLSRHENLIPYTVADENSNFSNLLGDCIITATPYELQGKRGRAGTAVTINFSVITPEITGLTLINGIDQSEIELLIDGSELDLKLLPPRFNFTVDSSNPSVTGSVGIELSGCSSLDRHENLEPYTVEDEKINFQSLTEGVCQLTATAYELQAKKGRSGVPMTMNFTVINSSNYPLPEYSLAGESLTRVKEWVTLTGYTGSEQLNLGDFINQIATFNNHVYAVWVDDDRRPRVAKYAIDAAGNGLIDGDDINNTADISQTVYLVNEDNVDLTGVPPLVEGNDFPLENPGTANEKIINIPYRILRDAHHQFTIGIDKEGYIHILGGMHHHPWGNTRHLENTSFIQQSINQVRAMYWVSEQPEDISSFRFLGADPVHGLNSDGWSYTYFTYDNDMNMYMSGRIRANNQSWSPGMIGMGIERYDTETKSWFALGKEVVNPNDPNDVDFPQYNARNKAVMWVKSGSNGRDCPLPPEGMTLGDINCNAGDGYQAFKTDMHFDLDNRMHIAAAINTNNKIRSVNGTISHANSSTHMVYAYSDDEGNTFRRMDGTAITLPISPFSAGPSRDNNHQGELVVDDVEWLGMMPSVGRLWDGSTFVTYERWMDDSLEADKNDRVLSVFNNETLLWEGNYSFGANGVDNAENTKQYVDKYGVLTSARETIYHRVVNPEDVWVSIGGKAAKHNIDRRFYAETREFRYNTSFKQGDKVNIGVSRLVVTPGPQEN